DELKKHIVKLKLIHLIQPANVAPVKGEVTVLHEHSLCDECWIDSDRMRGRPFFTVWLPHVCARTFLIMRCRSSKSKIAPCVQFPWIQCPDCRGRHFSVTRRAPR